MATTVSKIWCLLIDHGKEPVGTLFKVTVSSTDTVSHLKNKVKEKRSVGTAGVGSASLIVWRCMDPKLFATDEDQLEELLKAVSLSDKSKVARLASAVDLKSLDLLDKEMLLVQMPEPKPSIIPSSPGSSGMDKTPQESYGGVFIRRRKSNAYGQEDLALNGVFLEEQKQKQPNNVKHLLNKLKECRHWKDDSPSSGAQNDNDDTSSVNSDNLQALFEKFQLTNYFNICKAPKAADVPKSKLMEMFDVGKLAFCRWDSDVLASGGEHIVVARLFVPLLRYLSLRVEARTNSIDVDMKFGSKAWPLPSEVPVQVGAKGDKHFCKYEPKSNVSWWRDEHVLLLGEIQSGNGDNDYNGYYDYIGALCEGAYHVRLANANANAKLKNQDLDESAVVVAFYVSETCVAKLYYLFQEDPAKVDSDVKYVEYAFDLYRLASCQAFMRVLYNYVDLLIDENKPSGKMFFHGVPLASMKRSNEDQDHARGPSKQKKAGGGQNPPLGGSSGGNQDQEFTAEQYVLVPSFDFGLHRRPKFIFPVRKISDPNGTLYVAKKLRCKEELRLLEKLNSFTPGSEHIIQLIDSIEASVGKCIVLPMRQPVWRELDCETCTSGVLKTQLHKLTVGLAKGVTFLHDHLIAHLDIKQDNMVLTDEFCLQIIDFDVAVEVSRDYPVCTDYVGTFPWMAPEIERENEDEEEAEEDKHLARPYNPFLADRYSCGQSFLLFLLFDFEDVPGLKEYAKRLTNPSPQLRPSLREWYESDAVVIAYDGGVKRSADAQDGDGHEWDGRPFKNRRVMEISG